MIPRAASSFLRKSGISSAVQPTQAASSALAPKTGGTTHGTPDLNPVVYESLRPLALWLGLLVLALATADTALHFNIRGLWLTVAQFSFPASLLVLYFLLGRVKAPPRHANALAALIAFIILISCFVPPDFLKNQFDTWAIALVMVGAGCFVLSAFWLSLLLGCALAAWLSLTLVLAPQSDWTAAAFMNFAAASLAIVIRRIRFNALSRAERNADALRFSEERFRKLVENSTDALALISPSGVVLDAGSSVERVLGFRPEDLIGRNAFDMVHPDDLDQTRSVLIQASQRPRVPVRHECRSRTAQGEWIAVEAFVTNLIDEPSVGAIVINFRDVSERRRAEENLLRAMAAAEAANRAKTEFLANMSHEIRTPMNGVLGMTNLLMSTTLSDEQREYASLAKISADSLLTLIDEILDFSKVEAGKLVLEPIEFRLKECVELAVKLQALRAKEKGLGLSCEISPQVPDDVVGDPNRLRQIITNLISNAIKFTERGEVKFRAYAESIAKDSARIHFEIQDTGIGIPEDKQKSIFEPFSQADGSTARRFGGTGLGLTICSRLVEKMSGRIWVESRLGLGSTFHFTVEIGLHQQPARISADSQSLAQLANAAYCGSGGNPIRNYRVLLVEDNAINQRLALRLLEKHGHFVDVAADGRTAIAAFTSASYDVVLMDVQMPNMDGLEATALIRNMEQGTGRRVPVIAMTAHAMQSDREQCFAAGMDAYLSKPVDAYELLDAIQSICGPALAVTADTAPVTK